MAFSKRWWKWGARVADRLARGGLARMARGPDKDLLRPAVFVFVGVGFSSDR